MPDPRTKYTLLTPEIFCLTGTTHKVHLSNAEWKSYTMRVFLLALLYSLFVTHLHCLLYSTQFVQTRAVLQNEKRNNVNKALRAHPCTRASGDYMNGKKFRIGSSARPTDVPLSRRNRGSCFAAGDIPSNRQTVRNEIKHHKNRSA